MTKSKAIEAVRYVRKKQREEFDRTVFCRENGMNLQEILHRDMEKKLGDIAMRLEDILETGYVSPN